LLGRLTWNTNACRTLLVEDVEQLTHMTALYATHCPALGSLAPLLAIPMLQALDLSQSTYATLAHLTGYPCPYAWSQSSVVIVIQLALDEWTIACMSSLNHCQTFPAGYSFQHSPGTDAMDACPDRNRHMLQ